MKTTNVFFGPDSYREFLAIAVAEDFRFIYEDFAPDDIVCWWEENYDVHPVAQHALTNRLELELHNMHVILGNIPDDLLLAELCSPQPPRTLPEQWVS